MVHLFPGPVFSSCLTRVAACLPLVSGVCTCLCYFSTLGLPFVFCFYGLPYACLLVFALGFWTLISAHNKSLPFVVELVCLCLHLGPCLLILTALALPLSTPVWRTWRILTMAETAECPLVCHTPPRIMRGGWAEVW